MKPLNAALRLWMEDCKLRAPTLAECEVELAAALNPPATPLQPNRKRPVAGPREQTKSKKRAQVSALA